MTAWETSRRADVVVLTTAQPELDAVLAVEAGAAPGSQWELASGPNGLPVAFRAFHAQRGGVVGGAVEGGRPLRIAVALAPDTGAAAAMHTLVPLVTALEPRCVAMCGVCAGRRGATALGDVIAADRLYYRDTGAELAGGVEQDLTTYQLRDDWKVALAGMDVAARFGDAAWLARRPLSSEWRERRALIALRDGAREPWREVEPELGGDDWKRIVDELRGRGWLAASGRALTEAGKGAVDDLLFEYQGRLPDLSPSGAVARFRLHVAAMGSGTRVVEDERVWGMVTGAMRTTLALETEAAALGELVHRQRQRDRRLDVVVMKGVTGFADGEDRDPQFRPFAARAAAECLIGFLRSSPAAESLIAPPPPPPPGPSPAPSASARRTAPLHTVVFVAANPLAARQDSLGQRAHAMQDEIRRAGHRNCFAFVPVFAAQPLDLLRALRHHAPSIAHVSGHGDETGMYFEGEAGALQRVSEAALAETFAAVGQSVKLVVFDACYSEPYADAVLAHIDCVIGVSGRIGADAARLFTIGFYGGLGDGASLEDAYRHGCAAIGLGGSSGGDRMRLKVRTGIDARRLVLATDPP